MKLRILAAVLVLAVSLIGWCVGLRAQPPKAVTGQTRDRDLQRRIATTVREMGELQSARNVELRCGVPGSSVIVFVAPEGSQVKRGDLLVKLDSLAMEDAINSQKVVLSAAAAARTKAEVRLQLLERQRKEFDQIRQLQAKSADLARQALFGKGGELDIEIQSVEGEIRVFRSRLEAAKARMAQWKEKHKDRKPAGDIVVDTREAEEGLASAMRRRDFLKKRRIPQAEAKLSLEQALARFKTAQQLTQVDGGLIDARAEATKTKVELKLATARLKKLEENLAACVIRAPSAGTVVHANRRSGRAGSEVVIEVGANVRERQTLILLPDLSKMQLRTTVNETRIARVRVGQTATIRFDALSDQSFRGKVTRVGRYAEPTTFFSSQVKEYAVLVDLLEPPRFARVGMSAVVEINTGAAQPRSSRPARSRQPDRRRSSNNPTRSRAAGNRAAGSPLSVAQMVRGTMQRYDADRDGELGPADLAKVAAAQRKRLLAFDDDGDGKLTAAELTKAMESVLKQIKGPGKR